MKKLLLLFTILLGLSSIALSQSNVIYYTSTDGKVVKPDRTYDFGATIVSNTYTDGKGVITFDNDITKIGEYAFSVCESLESITIPESVTEIGEGAFIGCESLSKFNGKYASEDGRCLIVNGVLHSFAPTGLTEYSIPDGVTEVGEGAFFWCESLASITIPDGVTKIGERAFYRCESLTRITIPESVTKIGDWAFSYCKSLTSITIPEGVTKIGECAFNLCKSLTSITIPNSVTEIGERAFFGCESLRSITIPESVTEIEDWAFDGCESLRSVYCKPTIPPTGSYNMFYNNASDRKIYVHTESVSAYKAAEYWSDYTYDIVGYDF